MLPPCRDRVGRNCQTRKIQFLSRNISERAGGRRRDLRPESRPTRATVGHLSRPFDPLGGSLAKIKRCGQNVRTKRFSSPAFARNQASRALALKGEFSRFYDDGSRNHQSGGWAPGLATYMAPIGRPTFEESTLMALKNADGVTFARGTRAL